ncbi:MAG: hypothetical protein HY586_00475 [Candidatus Omnitrophica bacterium]|nr:hypothetical protein [Candidatus Omnitrophota bacterium]
MLPSYLSYPRSNSNRGLAGKDGQSEPKTIFDYNYQLSKLDGLKPEILDPNNFGLFKII